VLFLLWRVGIVGWVATISGSSAAVTVEQEVHLPRDTEPYVALAEQLVHDYPLLDPQDAVDIAVLLDAARKNSDTMLLVERFKEVKENESSDEEVDPTKADMVQKLAGVFEEMKQLEKQFRDPAQAVEDLYAEGKCKSLDYMTPMISSRSSFVSPFFL